MCVFKKNVLYDNMSFITIQVRLKLGLTINEIFKELKTALPKSAPSLSKVFQCFNKFKAAWRTLKINTLNGAQKLKLHRQI
jgi:hypothetical protein